MDLDLLINTHKKLPAIANEDNAVEYLYNKVIGFTVKDDNDVVRLAVLCYGWMPTMNKGKHIHKNINLKNIKEYLIRIQNSKTRKEAINIVFQESTTTHDFLTLTNNSVIGLSKALHIIRPDVFPIIDGHILNGLRNYGKYIDFPVEQIPNCKYPTHELAFFEYFTNFIFNNLPQFPVREIEKILFDLGKDNS